MKLSYRDIEPFVKSPRPAARVILVYGPDNGLVRERAKIMGLTIVSDLNDPFNAVTLSGDSLLEDTARLNDEASAMSMMGGGRLIRITAASDKITPIIKDYLENPSEQNLVIIEADSLGPRSALRMLCEKVKNAAAVPCYVEEERDISSLVQETVRHAGFTIDRDATMWLSANIIGDRARVRMELEKLLTYMGVSGDYKGLNGAALPPNGTTISFTDVQASCGSGGDRNLDDLVYSAASGDTAKAMRFLDLLLQEGTLEIVILRSLQNHFRRLHLTKSRIEQGAQVKDAVKSLTPRLFFKLENAFIAQLHRFSLAKLTLILTRLSELESQTKQSGTPVKALCAQAILSISR